MADFNFEDLTNSVRIKMKTEINSDIQNGRLYISNRLTEEGKRLFPELLKESVNNGNEKALSEKLKTYFNETEFVQGTERKVPSNASVLLSQSEFNRFYIRAICLESIENGKENVKIYRARESSWSRPESEALIGEFVNANELLSDLRESIGINPKLLPDINSGLSVKLT